MEVRRVFLHSSPCFPVALADFTLGIARLRLTSLVVCFRGYEGYGTANSNKASRAMCSLTLATFGGASGLF